MSSAKALALNENIPEMLEYIASVMDGIREMDETHDNLMKNTFDALLTVPNAMFRQLFQLEKMSWQGGTKTHDFDQLSTVAKSIYNKMITSGAWNAAETKDAQMLELPAKIEEL